MIAEVPFKKHWLLGHTPHFAKDTLGFVLKCAEAKLPLAKAKIAFKEFIVLLDQEAITHVLQKNNKNYEKSFAYKGLKEFLGNGLLTAEGDEWLKNRRKLQPAFHQKEIAKMQMAMQAVIDKKLQETTLKKSIDLQKLFLEWTRDILLKALFDLSPGEVEGMEHLHNNLWTLRTYANNRMKNPMMLPPGWPTKANKEFKASMSELESIISNIFKASREKENSSLLIQQMIEALKTNNWNDQQIFDEIITIFLAGQETTTNALVFLCYLMSKYPETIDKVNDTENPLNWEHVINETMRLYPPAWAVSRNTLEDDIILGEKINAGSTVFLSIYAMHRHPQLWEKPNDFFPERFIGSYPRQAFIPFGTGQRICIGNHFAMLEMKLIAQSLFNNFSIAPNKNDLKLITPITLGIRGGLHAIFSHKA
ncbi:MAG: cytochrome P450 [Bacteroidia bacterium]